MAPEEEAAMWVKVCANTTLEDARVAAEAGADAVGFVFAPSSRRVTAETVGRITEGLAAAGLGRVERVGVFPAMEAGEIVAAARLAGLTGVQLHGAGERGPAVAEAVRAAAPELAVVGVVHWVVGTEDAAERACRGLEALRQAGVRRVLLDSKVGTAEGGTGVRFAWAEAAEALAGAREGLELIVAGGLRPETVAEAVRVLRPWGVDVASGVEAAVGRKSEERVRAFVRAAREAD